MFLPEMNSVVSDISYIYHCERPQGALGGTQYCLSATRLLRHFTPRNDKKENPSVIRNTREKVLNFKLWFCAFRFKLLAV